jgi:hypothetical protein
MMFPPMGFLGSALNMAAPSTWATTLKKKMHVLGKIGRRIRTAPQQSDMLNSSKARTTMTAKELER